MPAIQTYERRVGTPSNTIGVAHVNLDQSGLQALGRGMGDVAMTLADEQAKEKQKLEQKTEDQAALTAANALSAGDEFWNQRSTELKQGWSVGGDDLRKKSDVEFKEWKDKQKQALPTEKSKMWFDQQAERMRSRMNQDLYNHQDRATTEKVVSDTKLGMDSDYAALARDPDRFDEITQRRVTAISAQSRLPEGKRSEIAMAYLQEAAASVEQGRMRRDPAGYLAARVKPQAARVDAGGEAGGAPFLDRIMQAESGGRRYGKDGELLTSSAGAKGEMQVLDSTNTDPGFGVAPARDNSPEERARVGRDYANAMLKRYGGDEAKAAAAYNAGPGAVDAAVALNPDGWVAELPAETQAYVKKVAKTAGAAVPGARPQLTAGGVSFADDAPKTFNALDMQKQYALVDEAERLVRQGNAQRQGEADRLMADALAMHRDGKQDPFNLTPDYFVSSYGPVEGPAKQAAYQAGRAMASDITNFAGQSDAQIQATLQASAPLPGAGYAAADARQTIRVQAAEQVVKQRREDPMLFAQRNGLTTATQIDMAKPEGIGTELNKRIGTARLMNEQYGAPYRILANNEAAQMSAALRLMPTQQKLAYLDAVRTGLLQDSNAYRAVLGQIAPDSPVTAVAGSILVKETPVTMAGGMFGSDVVLQPRNVAALMLEGEAILNPTKKDREQDGRGGKFPMPKDVDMATTFNGFVGEAFRGDPAGYDAAYQAYRAYYAGTASRKGVLSDALDSSLAKEAATAATGGVIDYNGLGTVMKPWGMADGDFKDRVSTTFNTAMVSNGLKGSAMDNLSAYGLQSIGEGRYLLTNGQAYLNGPRGPIELNVNPQTMRQKLALTDPTRVPPPDTARRSSGLVGTAR